MSFLAPALWYFAQMLLLRQTRLTVPFADDGISRGAEHANSSHRTLIKSNYLSIVVIFFMALITHAVGQQRLLTPQELQLLELQAKIKELEYKTRELELARTKREQELELERKQKVSRTQVLLEKHYTDSIEQSRSLFDGRTVDKVVEDILSESAKGRIFNPTEMENFGNGYRTFKLNYMMRAIQITIDNSLSGSDEFIKNAKERIEQRFERPIFGGTVPSFGEATEYNLKYRADYTRLQMMSKLSEAQRKEIAICQLSNQFTPSCTAILLEALK
jgi:hypothetical protein